MVVATVLVGCLTFVGTALATAAGFWQWHRTRSREAARDYVANRVGALKEIWEALSDLEEKQRLAILGELEAEKLATEVGPGDVAQVNLLLLRRAPFLKSDELEWTQAFMQHLIEINTLIRSSMQDKRLAAESMGDSGDVHEIAAWWATSMAQPAEAGIVAISADELGEARRRLGERYRSLVQGRDV